MAFSSLEKILQIDERGVGVYKMEHILTDGFATQVLVAGEVCSFCYSFSIIL